MSDRVFSYANWKLFCGFDPTYSEADRYKLQAMDGTSVEQAGDCCILSHNPFGGTSPMIVSMCATRTQCERDITLQQLINDKKMMEKLFRNMFFQMSDFPSYFITLSYLDDKQNDIGAFAVTSIHPSDDGDVGILYDVYNPIAKISSSQRKQMVKQELYYLERPIPNGCWYQRRNVSIFTLPTEQAVECMLELNPKMHFRLTRSDKELIETYNQTIFKSSNDSIENMRNAYHKLCKNALNAFILTNDVQYLRNAP